MKEVLNTQLPLENRRQGKVRDVYDLQLPNQGPATLLVATDRVSSFDVVMANGIPGRGRVLTQISKFWFEHFSDLLNNHLLSTDPADIPGLDADQHDLLQDRIMIGQKTEVIPIECVARGYLAGSGYKEYLASGTVCGIPLREGLQQCSPLPEAIFTPATKAAEGHDENISFGRACELVGEDLMITLREKTLKLYNAAKDYAAQRGIIIADTKFEFGLIDGQPEPILIDEILTPDSSRFWPADEYEPGRDQNSFDKQIVRNYLQELCDKGEWDKTPPGPTLPEEVVERTLGRYLEVYEKLVGEGYAGE